MSGTVFAAVPQTVLVLLRRSIPIGSIPAGNVLLGFARLELSSNVREPGLRLIRSLRSLTLTGLRLCRSIPVGSIPAGNVFHDFTSLNAIGTCVSTVSY